MTQTSLEIYPGSVYSPLVTFTWGVSNVARYCRWTEDLTIGEDTFLHEPSIKIFSDKPQGGGTEDSPFEIEMRLNRSPADTLSSVYAHAKVHCVIEEVAPDDPSTRQLIYKGIVTRVNVKPGGRGALARLKIAGPKRRLQAAAGIQALSTCPWILGQSPCGYDMSANKLTGTIQEIGTDGKANRILVNITSPTNMENRRWNRGYVRVDGLDITIRKSFNDNQWRFDLREIPPPDWENAQCELFPGCDGQIATCRLHGQEATFGGIGINMPDYNPLFTPA